MHLPVSANYLERALIDGFSADGLTLRHHCAGALKLLTGRLFACDPFLIQEVIPFTTEFPSGEFPVFLSIARFPTGERVAFATIRFTIRIPESWAMLVLPGDNVKDLKDDEFFGYCVDSATGCFLDATAAEALNRRHRKSEAYHAVLQDLLMQRHVHEWGWFNLQLEAGNLVAFTSGKGDGQYASYAGFDADGQVCAVVTDFDVRPGQGPLARRSWISERPDS